MTLPPRVREIHFTGMDERRHGGRLTSPAAPVAFAVFAHQLGAGTDRSAASRITRALTERGIASLEVELAEPGTSGAAGPENSIATQAELVVAASDHLRRSHGAPSLLIGHGRGGTAVLAAAARIPGVRAAVTVNTPREAVAAVAGFDGALLVVQALADAHVPLDDARELFAAAHEPRSFVTVDGADHLLTRAHDADYVAMLIGAWSSRPIGSPAAADPSHAPGVVVVRERGGGRFEQEILVGRHRLTADEPEPLGGDDRGPSPYEFLLAGLGACTAMTLRLYATHKQLPLERVRVQLRHEKIHAADCQHCETRAGMIDRIERVIELEGELDAAQRQRLLEIAEKCPVHRTLRSEIDIVSSLTDAHAPEP